MGKTMKGMNNNELKKKKKENKEKEDKRRTKDMTKELENHVFLKREKVPSDISLRDAYLSMTYRFLNVY